MKMNKYNGSESQYSDIISKLKELPKIKAPDDFEFKLMTKIENEEFEPRLYRNKQFSLVKFLTPAAVVAVTAVILFFIIPSPQVETDNPLMAEPKPIENLANPVHNEATLHKMPKSESKTEPKLSEKSSVNQTTPNYRVVVRPNDVVTVEKNNVPLNDDKTINLDEYISGQTKSNRILKRGNLVSAGDSGFDFNGFLVGEELDQKTIEKYRAVVDSINRAKAKQDSLRRENSNLKEP